MSRTFGDIAEMVGGVGLDIAAVMTGQPELFMLGTGLLIAGVGDLLGSHNGNPAGMSTNPISPWEVVYGTAAVSGKVLYISESGDSDKQLSIVYVLACCPSTELVAVLLNGKRVVYWTDSGSYGVAGLANTPVQDNINFSEVTRVGSVVHVRLNPAHVPTYPFMVGDFVEIVNFQTGESEGDIDLGNEVNGTWPLTGVDTDNQGFWFTCSGTWQGTVTGTDFGHYQAIWPDWKGHVYCELTLNGQDGVNPFPSLTTESNGQWTTDCSCTGKTMVRLKFQYDPNLFSSGIPQVSFILKGYNKIYDPRLGDPTNSAAYGWSNNAALIIGDLLTNTTWGMGSTSPTLPGPSWGVELPVASWQNAANICDEQVATLYGTEPRYSADICFPISAEQTPGNTLKNLLTSCAGRLVYESGMYQLQPAAWNGIDTYIGDGLVVVPGTSAPWLLTTANTAISIWTQTSGNTAPAIWPQAVTPGDTIAIQTMRGKVKTYLNSQWSDADGLTIPPESSSLAFLLSTAVPGFGVHGDGTLVGAFCDSSGNVVGSPFVIGMAGGQWTVPAGASQLSMGVLDETWQYNSGSYVVNITSTLLGPSLNLYNAVLGHTHEITQTAPQHFNACRIQHISAAYRWQQANAPTYVQDTNHGYATDALLALDNGNRRYLNIQLPATISVSAAQRIAKIMLLRSRHLEHLSLTSTMALYTLMPLSTIALTFPDCGMVRWPCEVASFSLTPENGIGCQMSLEGPITASDYEWNYLTEELPADGNTGFGSVTSSTLGTVAPPTSMSVTSSSSTSSITASGVSTSQVEVVWTPPADSYVLTGGSIMIQTSINGGTTWVSAGTANPNAGVAYLSGFSDGATVEVQLQSVNLAGAVSGWITAGSATVAGAPTALATSAIATTGATSGQVLAFNGTSYVPTSITSGTPAQESPSGTIPGTSYTLTNTPIPGSQSIYLNGVWQPPAAYTLTGASLTLSTSTETGDSLWAVYEH